MPKSKRDKKNTSGAKPKIDSGITKTTRPKHRIIFIGDVHNESNSIHENMKRAFARSIKTRRTDCVTLLELTSDSDNGGHIGKMEYVSEVEYLTTGKSTDASHDRKFLIDLCGKSTSIVGFDVDGKFDSVERHNAQFKNIKKAISKDMGKVETPRDYYVIVGEAHLEASEGWVPHHEKMEMVSGIEDKAEVFCYSYIQGEDGKKDELNYDDV